MEQRTGALYVQNDWSNLKHLTVRHLRGNDPGNGETFEFEGVKHGDRLGPLSIQYIVGIGSPFDYWWLEFTTDTGLTFSIKPDFYCYISSNDDGQVLLRLSSDDRNISVSFSASTGCQVEVSQTGISEHRVREVIEPMAVGLLAQVLPMLSAQPEIRRNLETIEFTEASARKASIEAGQVLAEHWAQSEPPPSLKIDFVSIGVSPAISLFVGATLGVGYIFDVTEMHSDAYTYQYALGEIGATARARITTEVGAWWGDLQSLRERAVATCDLEIVAAGGVYGVRAFWQWSGERLVGFAINLGYGLGVPPSITIGGGKLYVQPV